MTRFPYDSSRITIPYHNLYLHQAGTPETPRQKVIGQPSKTLTSQKQFKVQGSSSCVGVEVGISPDIPVFVIPALLPHTYAFCRD